MKELTLEQMAKIDDGRIGSEFKQVLKNVIMDCEDRPGLTTGRRIIVTAIIKPMPLEDGNATDVTVDVTVGSKIPAR